MTSTESNHPTPCLEVAVPGPLRQTFHYLEAVESSATEGPLRPGARLKVTFNRRRTTAILIAHREVADVPLSKLRAIDSVIDPEPVLPSSLLDLCRRATTYYHHGPGDVFQAALPTMIMQGAPTRAAEDVLQPLTTTVDFGRAAKQQSLYKRLHDEGPLTRDALQDVSSGIIRALVERGAAAWQEQPLLPFDPSTVAISDPGYVANAQQQTAIDAIGERGTHLLFGVTGSGKTEVYLQLINRCLRAGKQALVLVPEIGLTPQTLRRFTDRFNVPVVAMHSGLSDRERLSAWQKAGAGHAGIIVGTRSAVFAPLLNPGLIVVDEEHDASYKQNDGFRYSARDLAVWRGQLEQTPVVLGSATPSLETLQNTISGRYQRHDLPARTGAARAERYELVNLQQSGEQGIARRSLEAIAAQLDAGNQVLVFINRRGYAPVLFCHQCRWIATCGACDARLTIHKQRRRLACHHCGYERAVPQHCEQCQSSDVSLIGDGTQRLEEQLQAQFAAQPVVRIDRDSTRRKGAMKAHLDLVATGAPMILVGTQLLAKGHHFPGVTLVVMLDIDSGFFSADFRADERAGQLVVQVGGRAGRAERPGTVMIQTGIADDPRLQALITEGYEAFASALLHERERFTQPPFGHHCLIRADSREPRRAEAFLESLAKLLPDIAGTEILGPVTPLMEKRAGRYRSQLLLTAVQRQQLHRLIDHSVAAIGKQKTSGIRWAIDVDPNESW